MTPDLLLRAAIDPALSLLPPTITSPAARTMLIAIALQESALEHRAQVKGPARSYWQFEVGGLVGVMIHSATRPHSTRLCDVLDYAGLTAPELLTAMTHNDVLAAGMARLNLYWHPWPIPTTRERAWDMYVQCWRPGKPHPERWPRSWSIAVETTG